MVVLTHSSVFFHVLVAVFCFYLLAIDPGFADGDKEKKQPGQPTEAWKKKDVRDYNDADVQRLFDQWEEGEDDPDPDDLPEHKRPIPNLDLNKLDPSKPEEMIQMTKKGKTLMMFATVSGNPTRKETEEITVMWQSMLFNAHYELTRYVIADDRIILVLTDGSKAFEIKNFLVEQERCEEVSFENQNFPGAAQIARLKAQGVDPDKKEEKDKTDKSKKTKKKDKKDKDKKKSEKKVSENDTSKNEENKVKTEL
ncbi:LDLR chaperone boca-like [Ptychodera flava]|uniref:LDLR chaperone boca-like n=1 Tax=Ptychodera flava TaxID=63121 RepID=UPI00396A481B